MHAITHSMLNTAETWYNKCSLLDVTGDDGPIVDPKLPEVPENLVTPWGYAPDYSNDPFPPYPPVTNEDSSRINASNLRGTRLFGWKGCSLAEKDIIIDTWKDFYKLAQQDVLHTNFDWKHQAMADFGVQSPAKIRFQMIHGRRLVPSFELRNNCIQLGRKSQTQCSTGCQDDICGLRYVAVMVSLVKILATLQICVRKTSADGEVVCELENEMRYCGAYYNPGGLSPGQLTTIDTPFFLVLVC
ncbi:hypothetical protein BJX63DRAFT_231074 [Aspergillus granulosus]|uniref:Uncharacterized protein n=1 Tax=Aspergillus granulosus TaxID=176169 RepID=A0ABR4HCB5_9EURO